MRFIAFQHDDGSPRLGVCYDQELVDLTTLGFPATLRALLQVPGGIEAARSAAARATSRLPLAGIVYLPPVVDPAKAIAVGLNYVDHAAESPYKDPPKYPVLFHRYPQSWVAHGAALLRPKVSESFDYEGEVVVVIGKAGRYIGKSQALDHVAGYSLFNDGSIRDYQFKSTQWMMGKNFDATGAFGPEVVTADELPAGAAGLQLRTRLNGTVMQDANTRDMIFDVATLVSVCSEAMTLYPGDIIISGTPSGVGFARKPPVWMQPGDVCEVEVEGIGVLRNDVADERRE
jgi:2-keto-4-pentenoate hydratase/2-oxohepta-3-ene-1,7-dioic acid hydratase in catechol pathway